MKVKIDFHAHTCFSKDSESKVGKVLQKAVEMGLDGIAITDHGNVQGALEAKRIAKEKKLPIIVIVGQEILTPHGEVMGLFLKKGIGKCSVGDAIAQIKMQGGVVSIPHPFDFARGSALHPKWILEKELAQVDAMETLNARVYAAGMNKSAEEFAKKHGLAQLGGSDAHTLFEVARAYTVVEAKGKSEREIKKAILLGKTRAEGKTSSPLVHLFSRYASLKKKIIKGHEK